MSQVRMERLFKGPKVSLFWKYLLFGFNSIFWLLGTLLVAIGLWAWVEKGAFSSLSSITNIALLDPVWIFILVGGVMFVLGFAGCIGALRENTYLLTFLSWSLMLIFLLEMGGVILVYLLADHVKEQLNVSFKKGIEVYRDDVDLQNLIDFTQGYWSCCGAQGPDDWNLNIYFNCTDMHNSTEKCGVPFSCCVKDPREVIINTQCGYGVRNEDFDEYDKYIYTNGCVDEVTHWIQSNWNIWIIVIVVSGFVNLIGTCLAATVLNKIALVKSHWTVDNVDCDNVDTPYPRQAYSAPQL